MWQSLLADAVAGILDRDYYLAICLPQCEADASPRGIFDGVGNQIVEYGADDFAVKVDVNRLFRYRNVESHVRIAVEILETVADFGYEGLQIGMCHGEAAVLGLCLAELQNLIDEVEEPFRAGMNALYLSGEYFRQTDICHQIFERPHDESEWSSEFMRDIGEEAQAFLVEFLFLLSLPAGLLERAA